MDNNNLNDTPNTGEPVDDFKTWGDSILAEIPGIPQTQRSLDDQLRVLQCVANKIGLYDAADSIGKSL